MRIRIQPFILMRIRIQLPKIVRIRTRNPCVVNWQRSDADPDPISILMPIWIRIVPYNLVKLNSGNWPFLVNTIWEQQDFLHLHFLHLQNTYVL